MPLCPKCREPMVQVEEDQVVAYSCPTCRGTWISGAALERRTRIETTPGQPHMELPSLPELAQTVTQANTTAALSCPDCCQVMVKGRFHPNTPVQIDRCDTCGHIWLDAGEQGLLLRLYQELVASQTEADPGRQQNLDRLRQAQIPTSNSGSDNADIALNVGMTVLSVLVDLFLTPGHSYRRGW